MTRQTKQSRLWVGASALALTMGLAACGGGGGGEGTAGGDASDGQSAVTKTKIRYTYATGDETWNAVTKAVVEEFNAQSETTEVQLDPLPAGSDYATALKTLDATGNWPAVIDMRDTVTYINAGKLAPVPESVTGLLQEGAFAAAASGEVYTVPTSALNGELGINVVYDKGYFSEHDLEVPATYAEFIELLDAIAANGDVPLATAAGEVWPSDQLWKPLASATFAQWGDEGGFWNAVAAGDATIEDLREPLERLKMVSDTYVLDGWQSTLDAQTTTLLVNGQAVMATSSAGLGRLMDINKVAPEFDAGIFIVPSDDGAINVLKNDVNGETAGGLAISAQAAEDEAELAAATEFLEFFYSVDAANVMEEQGWIAPDISEKDQIVRNTSIPGAADFFGLLENPKLTWYSNDPSLTNFSAFNTFFRQSRIEFQDDQTDIDALIAKVQTEFDSIKAQG